MIDHQKNVSMQLLKKHKYIVLTNLAVHTYDMEENKLKELASSVHDSTNSRLEGVDRGSG